MKKLSVKLGEFIKDMIIESKEEDQAKQLLDKGIMPDGKKWTSGIRIFAGFDGNVLIRNIKRQKTKDGENLKFDMRLSPGRTGGGGAGIDGTVSNQFFNIVGTDRDSINGMKKAFSNVIKRNYKEIGSQILKWFSNPDNWVYMVVGWEDRNNWVVRDVKILKINNDETIIDPSRKKWPSGRTEIWSPLNVTINATMRRK